MKKYLPPPAVLHFLTLLIAQPLLGCRGPGSNGPATNHSSEAMWQRSPHFADISWVARITSVPEGADVYVYERNTVDFDWGQALGSPAFAGVAPLVQNAMPAFPDPELLRMGAKTMSRLPLLTSRKSAAIVTANPESNTFRITTMSDPRLYGRKLVGKTPITFMIWTQSLIGGPGVSGSNCTTTFYASLMRMREGFFCPFLIKLGEESRERFAFWKEMERDPVPGRIEIRPDRWYIDKESSGLGLLIEIPSDFTKEHAETIVSDISIDFGQPDQ